MYLSTRKHVYASTCASKKWSHAIKCEIRDSKAEQCRAAIGPIATCLMQASCTRREKAVVCVHILSFSHAWEDRHGLMFRVREGKSRPSKRYNIPRLCTHGGWCWAGFLWGRQSISQYDWGWRQRNHGGCTIWAVHAGGTGEKNS